MFGLSLTKILFTLAAIVIVWQGFRLFQRREATRLRRQRKSKIERQRESGPSTSRVEETKACPVCAAYVPSRLATPCGRADCPYTG